MKKILLLLFLVSSSVYAQIDINQPSALVGCDSDNNGTETLDLTVKIPEILGTLNAIDYSVDFYLSMTGAELEDSETMIADPTIFERSIGSQTLYVRVEEIADPTEFALTAFIVGTAEMPVFTIQDAVICGGGVVTLYSGLVGDFYNFQWMLDGAFIPGANGNAYYASEVGTYTLIVTDSQTGCSVADNAVVTFVPMPTAEITGYSIVDQTATVSVSGTPFASVSYIIYSDLTQGTFTLDAAGNAQITISNYNPNSIFWLVNIATDQCTSSLDNSIALVENPTGIVNIPDANFKAKLIFLGFDLNNDGEIQFSEAAIVTDTIYIPSSNITDLTGLEAFVNITGLDCYDNQITTANFEVLLNLGIIYASNNLFTTIDLSGNPNICLVDFSNNPQLVAVYMKNGTEVCGETHSFNNNPNLEFVCTDEAEIASMVAYFEQNEMDVVVTSYCDFTPGGIYNTITGSILYDFDNNGCDDNDAQPFIKMNITDGTEQGASFADSEGNYTFYTQEGNFTVTPQLENPSLFNVSPANAIVNFPISDNSVSTNNFCITANGVVENAEIVVAPVTPARPGFDAEYVIVYKNTGNQMLSGQVYFYYEDTVLDLVSTSVPTAAEATGFLTWNYTDLQPFESRSIYVTLNVNGPMETPAVNIGDELIFNVGTNPINLNEIIFSYFQTVVGSFDPNDIICLQGDNAAPSEIGNYLHYIVNFENTGTAPAENVVVKIDIDATKYDVSSMQILNGSHPLEAKVSTDNVAEFIFKNINLDTNGHGNILLKMRTKESLNEGDTVTKKANIYFDYNFPIPTNDANTTFQDLSVGDYLKDESIRIYPNPAQNLVNIEADSILHSVEVYDAQGRLLMTHLSSEIKTMLDISDKANGVYFFKIKSEKGIKVEKIIKK